jgi:hypothetical protein
MRHQERGARVILLVVSALLALGGGAAMAQPAAAPAAQKNLAARQGNWPRKIPFGEFTVVLDAPQAESLEGTKLKARSTARVQRGEEGEASVATVWYEADVEIDRGRRTVTMVSVEVPRVDFPGAPPARQQRLAARLTQALNRQQPKLSLDDVLASTKTARGREEAPPKLNTEPPKILFETEPAILVLFDGEPRFRAVEGTKLERALNTPFLVLRVRGGACYLNGGTTWFRAEDPKGPWTKAEDVPTEAVQISLRDLKEGGVSDSELKEGSQSADKRVPKIIMATEPTELVVSDGPPRWSPAVEGELDAMSSSESDVFRTASDHQYFLVLSGRWYRSGSLEGPWTYVEPDRLPASFRKIPKDSDKADALASVPGTAASAEALADTSKPRTAAIRRSEARVNVTYDGEPQFEAVPGTRVEYAVNTPDQVLKIRGRYYICDQGVWFTGGSPTGPWTVADAIPEDEIQTIPPESPVYNTRYAYVYDSTPEVVYTAYTPGYLGSYPYYGTVVFGTGWFYQPWWGAYYYPRFWTWGFHARYAPWVGWGYGFGWGPAWAGFRYGFGWGWGARWCGPAGFFRPAWRNVNITRNVNVTRNVYNSGVNRTRTATTQVAARNTNASRQGANKTPRNAQSARGGRGGQPAQANRARPGAGAQKAKPARPHAGGARHGGGGGKKKG